MSHIRIYFRCQQRRTIGEKVLYAGSSSFTVRSMFTAGCVNMLVRHQKYSLNHSTLVAILPIVLIILLATISSVLDTSSRQLYCIQRHHRPRN